MLYAYIRDVFVQGHKAGSVYSENLMRKQSGFPSILENLEFCNVVINYEKWENTYISLSDSFEQFVLIYYFMSI